MGLLGIRTAVVDNPQGFLGDQIILASLRARILLPGPLAPTLQAPSSLIRTLVMETTREIPTVNSR